MVKEPSQAVWATFFEILKECSRKKYIYILAGLTMLSGFFAVNNPTKAFSLGLIQFRGARVALLFSAIGVSLISVLIGARLCQLKNSSIKRVVEEGFLNRMIGQVLGGWSFSVLITCVLLLSVYVMSLWKSSIAFGLVTKLFMLLIASSVLIICLAFLCSSILPFFLAIVFTLGICFAGVVLPGSTFIAASEDGSTVLEALCMLKEKILPRTDILFGCIIGVLAKMNVPLHELFYCAYIQLSYGVFYFLLACLLRRGLSKHRLVDIVDDTS
jgi:hypothetical protein